MPAKRTIRRRTIPQDFLQILNEYLQNRSMQERSTLITSAHKGVMMDVLAEVGIPEEGGHRYLLLDDPVEWQHYTQPHKAVSKKVVGIERKVRKSITLNEDRTMKLLADKGLLDQCTTTITVIDEDAILAAAYTEQISDEELKGLYDESETFAFYLREE